MSVIKGNFSPVVWVFKNRKLTNYHQLNKVQVNKNCTKMKVVFAFFSLVVLVIGAPQSADKDAVVVKSELNNIGVDGYSFSYETSNGIAAEEQGQLKNAGSENELLSAQGSFKYVGTDGVTYSVTYIADENGFQPQGAHLPVAP